jgi:hypothetical protein
MLYGVLRKDIVEEFKIHQRKFHVEVEIAFMI